MGISKKTSLVTPSIGKLSSRQQFILKVINVIFVIFLFLGKEVILL
jgi:hypothetical protein